MNAKKILLMALISTGALATIAATIWVFPKKETAKIQTLNKNINKISEEPAKPAQELFSNQKFSDAASGISFNFPLNWARPRVVKNGVNTKILFNNSLEILVAEEDSYKDKAEDKSNYTTIVIPVDESPKKVAVLTYKNNSAADESINEILNTFKVESQPQITLKPTSIVTTPSSPTPQPISYPSPYPTPNPTTFYSRSLECTYGCLSENKFQ